VARSLFVRGGVAFTVIFFAQIAQKMVFDNAGFCLVFSENLCLEKCAVIDHFSILVFDLNLHKGKIEL
jgi:hypothetical protein